MPHAYLFLFDAFVILKSETNNCSRNETSTSDEEELLPASHSLNIQTNDFLRCTPEVLIYNQISSKMQVHREREPTSSVGVTFYPPSKRYWRIGRKW